MNGRQPRSRTKRYFLPPQKNGRNIAPEQFPKLGGMGEGWKSRRGSRIGRGRREEGRVGVGENRVSERGDGSMPRDAR
jgi:hypothetical protein